MKKTLWKYLSFSSLLLPVIAISCNVREAVDNTTYIKTFNHENFVKRNFLINSVKRVENDYESLLHSPLIKWSFNGKARYDSINNQFYQTTSKYLTFNLAQRLKLYLKNDVILEFSNDSVNSSTNFTNSKSGIEQVFNSNDNNINSPLFFNSLKDAWKVEFDLRFDLPYVNNKGEKVNLNVNENDYWTSLQSKWDEVRLLFNNYGLKEPEKNDFNQSVSFELSDKNSNDSIENFLLNEIPNNLIFNPLPSNYENLFNGEYGKKVNQVYFTSPYVLYSNEFNKQIYLKNLNFASKKFVENNFKLNKIVFNFNPVPLDETTYQLQALEGFKQNLISEVDTRYLNYSQLNEINNLPALFNVTFATNIDSKSNPMKYFWNLDYLKNSDDEFTKKILFGIENSNEDKDNYFNIKRFQFRNILISLINPYSLIKLLDKTQYWNSLFPQATKLDGNDVDNYRDKVLFNYLDEINEIWTLFLTKDSLNKVNSYQFKENYEANILDLKESLKTKNFETLKKEFIELLNYFYELYQLNSTLKLNIDIPIFSSENTKEKNLYNEIAKIINSIDSRLNVSFFFADKNDKTNIFKYSTFIFDNSNFSSVLTNFLFNNNDLTLLNNLILFRKNINVFKSINSLESASKNLNYIFDILDKYFDSSFWSQIFTNNILNDYLNSHELDLNELRKKIISDLQTWSVRQQLDFINAFNYFIGSFVTNESYVQTNIYNREIIQIHFEKPLNDLGYTQYEDIDVIS